MDVDRTILGAKSRQAPKRPGMKYRHYAPKAGLVVVEGPEEDVAEWIGRRTAELQKAGKKVGIIATEETKGLYPQADVKVAGTREDEGTVASRLYAILREFGRRRRRCHLQ